MLSLLMGRKKVSIQLVSPASGDSILDSDFREGEDVSIQLVSPASGDCRPSTSIVVLITGVSIQLVSPASGD